MNGGWFGVSLVFCFGLKLKFKLETWTKLNNINIKRVFSGIFGLHIKGSRIKASRTKGPEKKGPEATLAHF